MRIADGIPGARRPSTWVALILLVALVLRAVVIARPWAEIDDLVLIDDSYLSLTVARQIGLGHGPWYGIAPTNGYQPLYVWLMAPVYACRPHDLEGPVRVALGLLVAADLVGLMLLIRVVRRTQDSWFAALGAGTLWALNPYVIATSLNGLETSLAFLAGIGTLDALSLRTTRVGSRRGTLRLGLWLGVGALARVDSLILWPIVACVLALEPGASRWRDLGRTFALAAVLFGLWPAYSWWTTGTLVPVSGLAVRHMVLSGHGATADWTNVRLPELRLALGVIVRRNLPLIGLCLLGACLALARRARGDRLRPALVPLAFALALTLAYGCVVFGHWHYPRYLFPWALALTILGAGALAAWDVERPWVARAALAIAALGLIASPAFLRLYRPGASPWGYLRIGQWAARAFPPGTVIGGSQTGAIGYVAESLTVVNLDGVVNRAAYDAMRQGRLADEIRASRVRWLLWQDDIAFLDRESSNTTPLARRWVRTVPGVRTWNADWNVWAVIDTSLPSALRSHAPRLRVP